MIIGFAEDSGSFASRVIDYLLSDLDNHLFCEIDPVEFFPLGGVTVENNTIIFPENKLYYCPDNDLLIFKGSEPRFERYRFLHTLLDIAQYYCHVRDIYTVNGIVSLVARTVPRITLTVFNDAEFQNNLTGCDLDNMTWEGVPAFNTFLLWVARRREIPGVSLWTGMPFYLSGIGDPAAVKKVLDFFNDRFALSLNMDRIEEKRATQYENLATIRDQSVEVDTFIRRLEQNTPLNQEEGKTLVKEVQEYFDAHFLSDHFG